MTKWTGKSYEELCEQYGKNAVDSVIQGNETGLHTEVLIRLIDEDDAGEFKFVFKSEEEPSDDCSVILYIYYYHEGQIKCFSCHESWDCYYEDTNYTYSNFNYLEENLIAQIIKKNAWAICGGLKSGLVTKVLSNLIDPILRKANEDE